MPTSANIYTDVFWVGESEFGVLLAVRIQTAV
jgi:hypothetical protein